MTRDNQVFFVLKFLRIRGSCEDKSRGLKSEFKPPVQYQERHSMQYSFTSELMNDILPNVSAQLFNKAVISPYIIKIVSENSPGTKNIVQ